LKNLNNIGIINDVCSLYDNQSIVCSELNLDPRLIQSIWKIDTIRNVLYLHGYELEYYFSHDDYKIELINALRQDMDSAIQDIRKNMEAKNTHILNYIYFVVTLSTLMLVSVFLGLFVTEQYSMRLSQLMHSDQLIMYFKVVALYVHNVYKKFAAVF